MNKTVAIIAPGSMGSGVGRRLASRGFHVVTVLDGRSEASVERARAAGMATTSADDLGTAAVILSIVPPAEAKSLASRLARPLTRAREKPVFVDCNAVNPQTVGDIARIVGDTGCPFVDVGIIGGPPTDDRAGPTFYASGEPAGRLAEILGSALEVRVLQGPVGAASALKMSYAGITKGLTALGAMMMLAASRAGAASALQVELARSQPALLAWLTRQMPGMFPKAYRWVAEMEEIEGFVAADAAAEQVFAGAADFYREIARDHAGRNEQTAALRRFLAAD